MKKTDKRRFVIYSFFVGVIFFIAVVVNREFLFNEIFKPTAKWVIRKASVISLGEKKYIEKVISAQYVKSDSSNLPILNVETSVLPLELKIISLAENGRFPSGAGSITNANGSLVILDRLGNIYLNKKSKLINLNYGTFPNGLKDYILHSKAQNLGVDALRAHSIAYDSTHSKFYVSYEKYVNPNFNRFVISSIKVNPNTLQKEGGWESVFETDNVPCEIYSQGAGGKIFIASDKLYFTTGFAEENEFNGTVVSNSQNLKSPFGKIYEYDLNKHLLVMKSYGHRNSQGLAVFTDGRLLNVEHGPQGGDEINVIQNGKNYGWPFKTYGTNYGAYDWKIYDYKMTAKYAEPLYAFVPSIGISSIFLVQNFNKRWNGDFLVGSLKAQSLFRIKIIENRVVFSEPIWIGHRIRDISSVDDKLVLLTDDASLIFINVNSDAVLRNSKFAGYNFEPKMTICLKCHHFERTTPANVAPSLANIINRKIASDNFLHYSEKLTSKGGRWTREALTDFIENPNKFAPGTTMPNLGLSKDEIKDIVNVLSKQ